MIKQEDQGLWEIKVGDYVVVQHHYGRSSIHQVVRVTPKMLECSTGLRFRKQNGREYGSNSMYSRRYIERIATPDDVQDHLDQKKRRQVFQKLVRAVDRLRGAHTIHLSVERLEELAEEIDPSKGEKDVS
jgi:hypothetical protein